jgi:GntR family transcriptional regulator
MLPPITQLADDLGVAVVTVRQAYELLAKEGLIRSQRGVGTHVAALPAAVGDLELAINDPFAAHRRSPSRSSKSGAAPPCRRT